MSKAPSRTDSKLFAAQVVLAGALSGATHGAAPREASQLEPNTVAEVKRAFQSKGFKIGPVVGSSFSIEGSAKLFRDTFGVDMVYGADGSVRHKGKDTPPLTDIPLSRLPDGLRRNLEGIVFSSPPAFGPGKMP